ncbi:MAG TPA: serine--tRNA ligase [Geminicoccaceae bacterium]|nr:serine--tRNA ligase [Geminicoccaceae bacterium]
MFDLKWLRENPDAFDASLARRGQPPAATAILALDGERRRLETTLQESQALRNQLSREIGIARGKGEDTGELQARVGALKDGLRSGEERLRAVQAELEATLASYPNVLQPDVPDGPDESANVELRRVGAPRAFDFEPRSHDELGGPLGMDFGRAAKLSGARFVVLWRGLARLERALAQFMLELQTREHGYTEVSVPYLVRDEALFGTNQLPKFADDLFRTTAGHWLIPTAEVSLTNLVREEILDEAHLPLRLTACTPCFRSEAGAAGRDTKGMIRQHQFTKVELVSVTVPEQSAEEHERMTAAAEAVLQRLELPYRVVVLAAGDTGFGATKTYDVEVWLPGQGAYREISSCSNCGDFQARRMNTRYRASDRGLRFVHTLPGSGLAVGRTLIAVLENYQEADGSVRLPEALRPFMDGRERLTPDG